MYDQERYPDQLDMPSCSNGYFDFVRLEALGCRSMLRHMLEFLVSALENLQAGKLYQLQAAKAA